MKPQDLKTGMIVTYRNGTRGIVMRGSSCRDQIVGMDDGRYCDMGVFRDDLTANFGSDFDIMKVEDHAQPTYLFRDVFVKSLSGPVPSGSKKNAKTLWKRNDPKDELKKVVDDLQKQLKDAQDKLAKM